jgi:RNA polymerase sigma-32 factor
MTKSKSSKVLDKDNGKAIGTAKAKGAAKNAGAAAPARAAQTKAAATSTRDSKTNKAPKATSQTSKESVKLTPLVEAEIIDEPLRGQGDNHDLLRDVQPIYDIDGAPTEILIDDQHLLVGEGDSDEIEIPHGDIEAFAEKLQTQLKSKRPLRRALHSDEGDDEAGELTDESADEPTELDDEGRLTDLPGFSRVPNVRGRKRPASFSGGSLTPSGSVSSSKALSTGDPVATYLSEIRRYTLLTREQEQELAIRYRETGDPKAAEALVTSNLRFVVKVAAEYSRFGAKLIDLIQEGNVGLMHAVKEFNPYKGVRLITYAVWWIRGYIQEYLMRQYSMVRIGTTQNQRKLFYKLQKEKQLIDAMGREPNYALLSSRLGVTEEEVETMTKRLSGRDISLSQPLDNGESTATLLDFESTGEAALDVQLGAREELEVLNQNIEKLRPQLSVKETFILEKRVLSDEPLTLQEIGEIWGVTREAVRQLEARLVAKIRSAVTEALMEGPHSDPDDE